jgi:hypothetical protein
LVVWQRFFCAFGVQWNKIEQQQQQRAAVELRLLSHCLVDLLLWKRTDRASCLLPYCIVCQATCFALGATLSCTCQNMKLSEYETSLGCSKITKNN